MSMSVCIMSVYLCMYVCFFFQCVCISCCVYMYVCVFICVCMYVYVFFLPVCHLFFFSLISLPLFLSFSLSLLSPLYALFLFFYPFLTYSLSSYPYLSFAIFPSISPLSLPILFPLSPFPLPSPPFQSAPETHLILRFQYFCCIVLLYF